MATAMQSRPRANFRATIIDIGMLSSLWQQDDRRPRANFRANNRQRHSCRFAAPGSGCASGLCLCHFVASGEEIIAGYELVPDDV